MMRLPLLAGALALCASACCPPEVFFAEDFEDCQGTCGWSVAGAGSASIVSTIHPGEHGLRLVGPVSIERRFSPVLRAGGSLSLISDCAAVGGSITLAGEAGEETIPITFAAGASAEAGAGITFSGIGASLHTINGRLDVLALSISVAQGECAVDSIRIEEARPCH